MNTTISVNKLQELVNENSTKEMTTQEITEAVFQKKYEILEVVSAQLEIALKEKDSAMVAAIAEVLKTI